MNESEIARGNGKGRGKAGRGGPKTRQRLNLRQAALEGEKNQVGTAAHTELVEQVRNVKFHGAFGDIELVGDFLVRKIFEKRVENFLLAAAEIGDGIGFQAAALAGEDRVHETGEKLPRNPETSAGNERESTNQLFAGFDVGEQALHTEGE